MITNYNSNHKRIKMETEVNRLSIAEETSPGLTHLFQRTSPTASANVSFF